MPRFLEPLLMGNPLLFTKSTEVADIFSNETKEIIEDLFYTIKTIGDRVGLAAPQVGILKRLAVFRIPPKPVNDRYKDISDLEQEEIPWSVVINPAIIPLTDEMVSGWEGCVSVPGMMGQVERYAKIKYTYFDANGEFQEREAHGFHARVIQHEFDHLDGILFPMRIKNMQNFGYEKEIIKRF
jgi:peptide deformylase